MAPLAVCRNRLLAVFHKARKFLPAEKNSQFVLDLAVGEGGVTNPVDILNAGLVVLYCP
jgi:hypothetical protein